MSNFKLFMLCANLKNAYILIDSVGNSRLHFLFLAIKSKYKTCIPGADYLPWNGQGISEEMIIWPPPQPGCLAVLLEDQEDSVGQLTGL